MDNLFFPWFHLTPDQMCNLNRSVKKAAKFPKLKNKKSAGLLLWCLQRPISHNDKPYPPQCLDSHRDSTGQSKNAISGSRKRLCPINPSILIFTTFFFQGRKNTKIKGSSVPWRAETNSRHTLGRRRAATMLWKVGRVGGGGRDYVT